MDENFDRHGPSELPPGEVGHVADAGARAESPREPYRSTTAPKLWPASGLLLRVENPVSSQALIDAIAPKCLLAPLMVRPQISGYLVFDDEGSEEGAPVTHVLTNGRISALRYCTISRKVPKAALVRARDAAIAKSAKEKGRSLTDHEALLVEARAYSDVLATALCDERETLVIYDHRDGGVFVGERTHQGALLAASNLDIALGKHSSLAPRFAHNTCKRMTRWLLEGTPPAGFTFGKSVRLAGANKAKAAFDEHVLTSKEVIDHLRANLDVTELQLVHEGRIVITLTQSGFVRGIELAKDATQVDETAPDEEMAGHSALLVEVLRYADAVLPAVRAAIAALAVPEERTETEPA